MWAREELAQHGELLFRLKEKPKNQDDPAIPSWAGQLISFLLVCSCERRQPLGPVVLTAHESRVPLRRQSRGACGGRPAAETKVAHALTSFFFSSGFFSLGSSFLADSFFSASRLVILLLIRLCRATTERTRDARYTTSIWSLVLT